MVWNIGDDVDGVILPFGGPQELHRRVLRKQTAEQILQDFPIPLDLGPDSFELQIKGLISPASEAEKLWEMIKRADQDSLVITVTGEPEFEQYNGQFLVNKSDIGMSSPMFDSATGKIVQTYDITFIQFAEQGDIGNGDSGEPELDEPGIGFGGADDIFSQFDGFLNIFNEFLS